MNYRRRKISIFTINNIQIINLSSICYLHSTVNTDEKLKIKGQNCLNMHFFSHYVWNLYNAGVKSVLLYKFETKKFFYNTVNQEDINVQINGWKLDRLGHIMRRPFFKIYRICSKLSMSSKEYSNNNNVSVSKHFYYKFWKYIWIKSNLTTWDQNKLGLLSVSLRRAIDTGPSVVNDLPNAIRHTYSYAENVKFLKSISNIGDTVLFQSGLNHFYVLCSTNLMEFNLKKCKSMNYSRYSVRQNVCTFYQ